LDVRALRSRADENSSKMNDILRWAIRFHGHLGPFLVLGLKAGFRAVELFGRNPFKLKAIVTLRRKLPYTCFLDGIQFSTGCTLGKGNIEVVEGDGIKVRFIYEDKELTLRVKEKVLREALNAKDLERYASKLLNLPSSKLFIERH